MSDVVNAHSESGGGGQGGPGAPGSDPGAEGAFPAGDEPAPRGIPPRAAGAEEGGAARQAAPRLISGQNREGLGRLPEPLPENTDKIMTLRSVAQELPGGAPSLSAAVLGGLKALLGKARPRRDPFCLSALLVLWL